MENRSDLYNEPSEIDAVTPYGKGLEPKVDNITDYGKGIRYKTCDGKEVATIEEVMQYNQKVFERLKGHKYVLRDGSSVLDDDLDTLKLKVEEYHQRIEKILLKDYQDLTDGEKVLLDNYRDICLRYSEAVARDRENKFENPIVK